MVGRPAAKGRVSSFAECNGRLYAAVYDAIYERSDGTSPTWNESPSTVDSRILMSQRNTEIPANANAVQPASAALAGRISRNAAMCVIISNGT